MNRAKNQSLWKKSVKRAVSMSRIEDLEGDKRLEVNCTVPDMPKKRELIDHSEEIPPEVEEDHVNDFLESVHGDKSDTEPAASDRERSSMATVGVPSAISTHVRCIYGAHPTAELKHVPPIEAGQVVLDHGLIIKKGARACPTHFDENGKLINTNSIEKKHQHTEMNGVDIKYMMSSTQRAYRRSVEEMKQFPDYCDT